MKNFKPWNILTRDKLDNFFTGKLLYSIIETQHSIINLLLNIHVLQNQVYHLRVPVLLLTVMLMASCRVQLLRFKSENKELKHAIERRQKENVELKNRLDETTQLQNIVKEIDNKLNMLR